MFRFFYERKVLKSIEKSGLALVFDDGGEDHPPYAYTTGLWDSAGSPELVVFGLGKDLASGVFARAFDEMKSGALVLSDGARWSGVIANFDCKWRRVHPTQLTTERFGTALWYRHHRSGRYDDLNMYQLVWPDTAGRFPWDEGCSVEARMDQMPAYLPRDEDNPNAWWETIAREVGYPG